jgi:predicted phage terminase large subunit-like protein
MRARRRETWGLVETVDDTCKRYRVDHLTILTLGQGHGLEQELRRLHSDGAYGVSMEAEVGDKEARAYAVQHLFSARQVYSPMYEDGTVPTWCEPLLDELCIFPRGQHDDFVDATVGCLRHLRQIGLMERREEFDRGEERSMMWETNRRVQLPYDL